MTTVAMFREDDYQTYEDALAHDAVYAVNVDHIEETDSFMLMDDIRAIIALTEKCIGTNSGVKAGIMMTDEQANIVFKALDEFTI